MAAAVKKHFVSITLTANRAIKLIAFSAVRITFQADALVVKISIINSAVFNTNTVFQYKSFFANVAFVFVFAA